MAYWKILQIVIRVLVSNRQPYDCEQVLLARAPQYFDCFFSGEESSSDDGSPKKKMKQIEELTKEKNQEVEKEQVPAMETVEEKIDEGIDKEIPEDDEGQLEETADDANVTPEAEVGDVLDIGTNFLKTAVKD